MAMVITRLHRPAIRLRTAVPAFDPPFDDEVASEVWLRSAGAAQLPLDFGADPPAPPPPAPVPMPAKPSPEARLAAHRFAATCVEILNGFRPAGHVRPFARPHNAELLITQLVDATTRLPAPPRRPAGSRAQLDLLKLRVIRVSTPAVGVVEAAATLGNSARCWAMAFRLERRADSDTWQGTALQVL